MFSTGLLEFLYWSDITNLEASFLILDLKRSSVHLYENYL